MHRLTVILVLAIGSFVFGLLLIVFQYRKNSSQKVPFWVPAKFLQGAGSLVLYTSGGASDFVTTMLANGVLLLGCAYEAWAVGVISGRQVSRRLHLLTTLGIISVCLLTVPLFPPLRMAVVFLIHSIFYFLPGWFLFGKTGAKSFLRTLLGISYLLLGMLFLLSSLLLFIPPEIVLQLNGFAILEVMPFANFCMMLISGFIMLMLAKERSDMHLQVIEKTLKRSEIQFQRIVETAIEGIIILDKNFVITFANRNMADMLGYAPEEILGRSIDTFIPEDQFNDHKEQMRNRANGQDAVYERCLRRKDGEKHWFLVSSKAIMDDDGRVEGSFAMFTDINHRKRMELLLEESNRQLDELTKKDGLTGIANRRHFDEVLAHEYSRLKRSHSRLSIILLDIDHFKTFNDFYGHVKGDECLRQIGCVLAGCTNRSVDLAARYGGEEFACILPDTDISGAVMIAENIRQGIQALAIPHKGSAVSEYVTASFGVTTVTYSKERSVSEILMEVDKLLYRAKSSGRNRVESMAS